MARLVFDIETVGENFDAMDEITQETLTRWIKKEANSDEEYKVLLKDMKNRLGFSPLTAEVVVIGVLNYEENKGVIYFQAPGANLNEFEEGNFKFRPASEKEMLEDFWKGVAAYDEFISFNGRRFDVPFLMIRSAIHRIKPTKNLMSNRYLENQKYNAKHIDLLDQLTFYGAAWKKGDLHLWSRAFGIESPKSEGSGEEVGKWFEEGKFVDIAKYNVKDLIATKELYDYWNNYLKF